MMGVFGSNFRTMGWRLAFLAATGFVLLMPGIQGDEMTTPIAFNVFTDDTNCAGAPTDQGTTTYLAPLPELGSFCENSITAVDSGDGSGTMVDTTIYTKISILNCDPFSSNGYVFGDVYLCYDANCGNCDSVPIKAQLHVPPTPAVDSCWGISSTAAQVTSYQQFVATADTEAVGTYWKIFADHSCIGDVTDSAASSATTTVMETIIFSSIVAAIVVFV